MVAMQNACCAAETIEKEAMTMMMMVKETIEKEAIMVMMLMMMAVVVATALSSEPRSNPGTPQQQLGSSHPQDRARSTLGWLSMIQMR